MVAALITLFCAMLIAPGAGAAILAVVLCLSLSRSHLDENARGRMEAALVLPVVSLVATGVGVLLHHAPWLGAAVFIAGMFVSIWLRRFGMMAQRAGTLIALPLLVLLVTPYVPAAPDGLLPPPLAPVAIALLALLWVSVLHALARRVRWLPPARVAEPATPANANPNALRPIASTRMAIQMALALSIAFAIGYGVFADRWAWIVLTAFIVLSGNRGRLDVMYKSGQRVLGAAGGTLVALTIGVHVGGHNTATVALMLAAIFFGVWLRPISYGWWALLVTLALALLQGFDGVSTQALLGLLMTRMEEIVMGAVIGVAVAWWVLPVRSEDALRLRIAQALAALSEALDPATPVRTPDAFIAALEKVDEMAPAFRASRAVAGKYRALHEADWIDALHACRAPAVALIEKSETPGAVRNAVGAARKAMRVPEEILPAMQQLKKALGA